MNPHYHNNNPKDFRTGQGDFLPSRILKFLIILFWFAQIAGYEDLASTVRRSHEIYEPIRLIFTNYYHQFPAYELLIFLLITYAFFKYRIHFDVRNSKMPLLFIFSLLFLILALVNPNNFTQAGIYEFLRFKVTRSLLVALFFIPFVLFQSPSFSSGFIKLFLKYGLAITSFRVVWDNLGLIVGLSPSHPYGMQVTTLDSGVHHWIVFFMMYLLYLVHSSKEKKYLILLLFYIINLVFTYKRTSLFIMLFCLIAYYIFVSVRQANSSKGKLIVNFGIVLFIFAVIQLFAGVMFESEVLLRYLAVFNAFGYDIVDPRYSQYGQFSDSGHVQQTSKTLETFFYSITQFWGGGISRRDEDYLFVEGQSQGGVHNAVVAFWQYFGVPGSLFYLYINLKVVFGTVPLIRRRFSNYDFLSYLIGTYLISRFVAAFFSGDNWFLYPQLITEIFFMIYVFWNLQSNSKLRGRQSERFPNQNHYGIKSYDIDNETSK